MKYLIQIQIITSLLIKTQMDKNFINIKGIQASKKTIEPSDQNQV